MVTITAELIKSLLKPRLADSHKGTYGHALLVAGAVGKMGAAVIAAKACMRSGVGLLTVNVPFAERSILQISLPESMLSFRDSVINNFDNFSSIGIGPGLGKAPLEKEILKTILKINDKSLLIDADALNIIAASKKMLGRIPENAVLTPHPKEFDRLFGEHESTEKREEKAVDMALKMKAIIVLKGYQTFVTDGNQTFINITGNSGLAKAGSGDALTGLITGLLAQHYTPLDAALTGVYIHGLAAQLTLSAQTMETMIMTDIIDQFGSAFSTLL